MSKAANKQLVLKRKEEGASLIEYAVIAALVVALAVAGFATLGDGLDLGDDFENQLLQNQLLRINIFKINFYKSTLFC